MTSWPYNDRPAGFSLPDYGLNGDDQEQLTDRIWLSLVSGADDVDDFVDTEDGEWSLTQQQLREAFQVARRARLGQQAAWTADETLTNLDRAFSELNSAGILARQNFTCCGTCGAAEISGARDESRHWRGYVYFHQQDTENLIETGSVYLAYGVFPTKDFDRDAYERMSEEQKSAHFLADLHSVIGDDVIPRLASQRLKVEWDGDHRTRILLQNAQWYARLG